MCNLVHVCLFYVFSVDVCLLYMFLSASVPSVCFSLLCICCCIFCMRVVCVFVCMCLCTSPVSSTSTSPVSSTSKWLWMGNITNGEIYSRRLALSCVEFRLSLDGATCTCTRPVPLQRSCKALRVRIFLHIE